SSFSALHLSPDMPLHLGEVSLGQSAVSLGLCSRRVLCVTTAAAIQPSEPWLLQARGLQRGRLLLDRP
ncbi:uncharacterized, partial [Tachysurus ichikawai]